MNVLLTDSDLGMPFAESHSDFEKRTAARAILFNSQGQVALLKVDNGNYHKLPGGGVELDEKIEEALIREIREEVGASIQIEKKLGTIEEYRSEFRQIQESHFFICQAIGDIAEPMFTEREINDGFSLLWCPIETAVDILKTDRPLNYIGKFINKRDLIALEESRLHLNTHCAQMREPL